MKNISKNILQIIVLYIVSVVMTLFIFYTMGWYVFNMLPTELVMLRMLFSSIVLTVLLEIIVVVIHKIKR